jgi:hypothetical protein
MAEQVNVPGIGKTNRTWVIGGLAAVAGIVIYAYMRRAGAQGPAPGSDEQLDQAGYIPSDWSPDAYVGATQPGGETYDPSIVDQSPMTNAEWSQRIVDLLEGVGYDRNKAAATVGKYLAGQPLDASEKLIIQTAIALLGNPPAGALPIISAPATPTPTTPAPTTGPGAPRLTASFEKTPYKHWHLKWTRPAGAVAYGVYRRNHASGKYEIVSFTVATGMWVRNGDDWYSVKARNSLNKYGLSSNPVHTTRR